MASEASSSAEPISVSIVVPTRNRASLLARALASLKAITIPRGLTCEIVVVDNASSDATAEEVLKASAGSPAPIRYVCEKRTGVAQARNTGVSAAQGTWIAFFDDDETAAPDWLEYLLLAAEVTGASCVGGAYRLDLSQDELSRLSPTCRAILGEKQTSGGLCRCTRRNRPGTGNALVSRDVFLRVGGFDEMLARGGSDWDFFARAERLGYQAWYTPDAIIYHHVPSHRMTQEYLLWASLRHGASLAFLDLRERGTWGVAVLAIFRAVQAIGINLPIFVLHAALAQSPALLGRKCLLWRAIGYSRQTLRILAPRMLPQAAFFESIEFHRELEAVATRVLPGGRAQE